jgi:fructose-bisphosphate aldolase class I
MTVDRARLEEAAQAMVAEGRGILAADESNATMTKRLEAVGVESTDEFVYRTMKRPARV